MKRPKLGVLFDFVRRERFYFLVLLLTLTVVLFSQDVSVSPPEVISPELEQLKQSSKKLDQSLQDTSVWIRIFEQKPAAVCLFGFFILLFTGLFFGGAFLLISIKMIPRMQAWFRETVPHLPEPEWEVVWLFRVLILGYAVIVVSGVWIGGIWDITCQNENFIGLFHTLAVDLLVCFTVFAVLKNGGD